MKRGDGVSGANGFRGGMGVLYAVALRLSASVDGGTVAASIPHRWPTIESQYDEWLLE